jgi:hypothetical protein
MACDENAKRFISLCDTFLSLSAVFPLVEAGCEMGYRLLRRLSRGASLDAQAPRNHGRKARKSCAKRALKAMKSLACVNLRDAPPAYPSCQIGRSQRISAFLVNQTFRKVQTQTAESLTCLSPFHIMNKQRTYCGEVQAGLFRNNAAHAEGR